jgi:predicted nucleic acid-binding protein
VKLVVDTNIVFSAIISDKGKITELLLHKPVNIQFFAPSFLLLELHTHKEKLLSLTSYTETDLEQIISFVTKNISFVSTDIITAENWDIAYLLTKDIDEKDVPFVALSIQIDGLLWTGDKKLINGLNYKNHHNIITTDKLYSNYFSL